MYSFYGGKQGRTYHIVKTFASIHDMVTHFQNGGQYVDVMYHEYVLIDTTRTGEGGVAPLGINDLENGCLYRRGFDYNQNLATKPTPQYDNNGHLTDSYKQAFDEYKRNPGAGAIYVGCIRGSEGPGVIMDTDETEITTISADGNTDSEIENNNKIKIRLTPETAAGQPTTYALNSTVPAVTFKHPTVEVVETANSAGVTIERYADFAPFLFNSTFDIPRGLKGDSVTSATLEGDPGAKTIDFTITSYTDGGSDSSVKHIPYYGLEKLETNTSNMHLMATYTQPLPLPNEQGSSTVSDLGKLQYGILTQPTVYRMTKSDSNTSSSINPSLPTFTSGDLPITLQILNTTSDSTDSTNVIGTYLLGYDASTTHTSKFDEQHILQSNWYKMQDLSSIDAVPGKIITAGIMSDTGKIGEETITYVNDVKANIDLLSSNGFIFNAIDTEIHEFGTATTTHPTASSYSANANSFYEGTRGYIYPYVQQSQP